MLALGWLWELVLRQVISGPARKYEYLVLLVAHGRPQGLAKPFEARWIALDELVVEQHDALELRGQRYRSPWQNGVAERWIGSVRRELLDQVVVFNERHLRRLLNEYVAYYHDDRTHDALAKETPAGRRPAVPQVPCSTAVSRPRLGGLHHRYEAAA